MVHMVGRHKEEEGRTEHKATAYIEHSTLTIDSFYNEKE
jgi:hypothetical protein